MPSCSAQERLHLRKCVFQTWIDTVDMPVIFRIVQKFGDMISVKQKEERSRLVYLRDTRNEIRNLTKLSLSNFI